jgi:FG-GAP-like repeat
MKYFLILSLLALNVPTFAQWHYIMADSTRAKWGDFDKPNWLRYYGLDFKDINRDGFLDIVAGRYVYHNPKGNMEGIWKRTDLGLNVDGLLFMEVDGDEYPDFIAEALPNVYWFEATNKEGTAWTHRIIAQIPKTGHVNGQGSIIADVIKGGLPEILLASNDGIFCLQVPPNPNEAGSWPKVLIAEDASDEGIGVGDIDGDGDLDVVAGMEDEKGKGPNCLYWFSNPGTGAGIWKRNFIGKTAHDIDRIEVADLDGDKRPDVAITEERYPGLEPDASLVWFGNKPDGKWSQTTVITEYSINNLDAADVDKDGDIDLITNEHKGKVFKLQLFENDGRGRFTERVLDTGKESHLGTQFADLDNDGDLDLASVAWDNYKFLHIWRNDNKRK